MPWTFEIQTGRLYDPQGDCLSQGYSGGNCGRNPEGINNPADESLKDIGPLPEGLYSLSPPISESKLGPFAIPLLPDSGNQMYGRGDFYCHGDSLQHPGCASEGCIILPLGARHALWNSGDHQLRVVAHI